MFYMQLLRQFNEQREDAKHRGTSGAIRRSADADLEKVSVLALLAAVALLAPVAVAFLTQAALIVAK